MQVMPPTARWTAKKIGLTNFQPHHINDRDTNIAIGTGYLKLVLDDFAGSMPWPPPPTTLVPAGPEAGADKLAHRCWKLPFGPKTCRSPKRAIMSKKCCPTPPTTQRSFQDNHSR
jgi:hypothetical protein